MANAGAPLRFSDGALFVLDQRRLPAEEVWIRCETPREVADCIRTMAVRGAPAIGLAAAYGMALAAEAGADAGSAAAILRDARPTAVNLAWAVDRLLEADEPLELRAATPARAGGGRPAPRRARRGALRAGRPRAHALQHRGARDRRVRNGRRRAAAAWEQGRLAQVWVDETRPLLQGARLTAWELRGPGSPSGSSPTRPPGA